MVTRSLSLSLSACVRAIFVRVYIYTHHIYLCISLCLCIYIYRRARDLRRTLFPCEGLQSPDFLLFPTLLGALADCAQVLLGQNLPTAVFIRKLPSCLLLGS